MQTGDTFLLNGRTGPVFVVVETFLAAGFIPSVVGYTDDNRQTVARVADVTRVRLSDRAGLVESRRRVVCDLGAIESGMVSPEYEDVAPTADELRAQLASIDSRIDAIDAAQFGLLGAIATRAMFGRDRMGGARS